MNARRRHKARNPSHHIISLPQRYQSKRHTLRSESFMQRGFDVAWASKRRSRFDWAALHNYDFRRNVALPAVRSCHKRDPHLVTRREHPTTSSRILDPLVPHNLADRKFIYWKEDCNTAGQSHVFPAAFNRGTSDVRHFNHPIYFQLSVLLFSEIRCIIYCSLVLPSGTSNHFHIHRIFIHSHEHPRSVIHKIDPT